MPTEHIKYDEVLRKGTDKLNSAIDQANKAETDSSNAVTTANSAVQTAQTAETKAESVQVQFNQVVIEGDSSVEAAQARVKEDGTSFTTLKGRLDESDAVLAGIATKIKGIVSPLDYEHIVVGDDWSAAFQEAVNDALRGTYVGDVYYPKKLEIPEGDFKIYTTVVVDGAIANLSLINQLDFYMAGKSAGTRLFQGSDQPLFKFLSVKPVIEHLRFRGTSDVGKAIVLGEADAADGSHSAPKQGIFNGVQFYYWHKCIEVGHMYDFAFYNCGFFSSRGTNPIILDVLTHNHDNTNNLAFYRCHWEQGVGATFIKIKGDKVYPSQLHTNFYFHGCHMEARSFNTTFMDLYRVSNVSIKGIQCTQNNTIGETQGVTTSNFVPMFKLIDVYGFHLEDGTVNRIVPTNPQPSYSTKILEVGGYTRNVTFEQVLFETGATGNANPSKNDIIQNSSTTPLVNADIDEVVKFKRCAVNDMNTVSLDESNTILTSPTYKNRRWQNKYNSDDSIQWGYSLDSNPTNNFTSKMILDNAGNLYPKQYASDFNQSIPNNGSASISVDTSKNPSRRGMYVIMANTPSAQSYAIVYTNGTNLAPVFVGNDMVVADTNQNTSGKFNVYLSSGRITVTNLYGSERTVSIIPFVFR
ncbi:hypothetical protein [Metabacillus sp. FJAT-53654]|uniref:Pectate lyase superfamily protein domain-containing protein n=1 Tax=Metabacillus rhizosphaerae TaxID=3117747 RepID=A0ABZ2MYB4_9BACI